MERQRISTGTEWESRVGYSRAVRVGDRVLASGTTATDEDGNPVAPGDPERQTRRTLEIVVDAVVATGGAREDVVRTRLYVTDADDWEVVGEVHGEFFGDVRPATTMVEVSGVIHPEYVVEVEAEAVVPREAASGTPRTARRVTISR
jgi:enamine deaminase RidA (YjgF/YER057c/UK114 family)